MVKAKGSVFKFQKWFYLENTRISRERLEINDVIKANINPKQSGSCHKTYQLSKITEDMTNQPSRIVNISISLLMITLNPKGHKGTNKYKKTMLIGRKYFLLERIIITSLIVKWTSYNFFGNRKINNLVRWLLWFCSWNMKEGKRGFL